MSAHPSPRPRDHYSGPTPLKRKEPPDEITVRRATVLRLCAALEEIISRIKNQVYWLKDAAEERALRWRCLDCGHLSHFSTSKPITTVTPCPKCQSEKAEPLA